MIHEYVKEWFKETGYFHPFDEGLDDRELIRQAMDLAHGVGFRARMEMDSEAQQKTQKTNEYLIRQLDYFIEENGALRGQTRMYRMLLAKHGISWADGSC